MPLLSNLFRWLKLRSIRSPFCRLSYVRRVVSLWVVLLFCLFLLIFLSKDSYEKTKGRKLIQRTRTSLETKAAGVTKETDHQYISSAKVQTWPGMNWGGGGGGGRGNLPRFWVGMCPGRTKK